VNEKLKKELPSVLVKAYLNSAVEQRKTLLFGHKASPFKPYKLTMTNGQQLDVHSKIEYMIAKNLDALGVSFEYDVSDFEKEYHLRPDFKITIADKIYYWEHLGNIGPKYANRWSWKIGTYKNIGIFDSIITTSESETPTDIQNAIATIISDLKNDKLIKTEGSYSNHHYYV
jgi:predicted nuclease of restriction endonuclease-like RecB superfamily